MKVEILEFYRDRFSNYKKYDHLLHFKDVNVDGRIAKVRLIIYAVFEGDEFGTVPVLRISTAYDQGHCTVLSQVVDDNIRPVMGETAIVSPVGDQLLRNEEMIAMNAVRVCGGVS
ncbi:MAG: hypothetical protein AAFV59_14310 [Pseudomonadota bacterium]